jgi:hypothetical protein
MRGGIFDDPLGGHRLGRGEDLDGRLGPPADPRRAIFDSFSTERRLGRRPGVVRGTTDVLRRWCIVFTIGRAHCTGFDVPLLRRRRRGEFLFRYLSDTVMFRFRKNALLEISGLKRIKSDAMMN